MACIKGSQLVVGDDVCPKSEINHVSSLAWTPLYSGVSEIGLTSSNPLHTYRHAIQHSIPRQLINNARIGEVVTGDARAFLRD